MLHQLLTMLPIAGILLCPFTCIGSPVAAKSGGDACCNHCCAEVLETTANADLPPAGESPLPEPEKSQLRSCVCQSILSESFAKPFELSLESDLALHAVPVQATATTCGTPLGGQYCSWHISNSTQGVSLRIAYASLLL